MASEYLRWKYRDVQPDKPVELTKKQRRRNWWHYHKWFVLGAAALALVAANLIWHALSQVRPDYQIAYVGSAPLPEEEAAAWEGRLAARGTDCDGDGEVTVQLNQYLTGLSETDAMYAYAGTVKLMADLDECDSYFFLLEDPERFQTDYEILREDWIPAGDGLFLARRDFWGERTAAHMEACGLLWEALKKEASQ